MADEYRKGTVVQVLKQDSNGQPTEHIERDQDGGLWHVQAGAEKPARIRDESEISSLLTEANQRHSDEK